MNKELALLQANVQIMKAVLDYKQAIQEVATKLAENDALTSPELTDFIKERVKVAKTLCNGYLFEKGGSIF